MAAYKDLIGQKITKVTSNPSEPKTGQMWYNSTDGALRGLGVSAAFSSSAPTLTTRDSAGASGTQTANIIAGGASASPQEANRIDASEEYNGSGFSSGGALGTGRGASAGAGVVSTAGLIFGGFQGTANHPGVILLRFVGVVSSWSHPMRSIMKKVKFRKF